jgi:hypothetical protein
LTGKELAKIFRDEYLAIQSTQAMMQAEREQAIKGFAGGIFGGLLSHDDKTRIEAVDAAIHQLCFSLLAMAEAAEKLT